MTQIIPPLYLPNVPEPDPNSTFETGDGGGGGGALKEATFVFPYDKEVFAPLFGSPVQLNRAGVRCGHLGPSAGLRRHRGEA